MDVQAPQLPANEFDVIHSNATWEHIAEIPAANRTVAQALRPGGIAYIEIHLFPSLSGGHDLPWIVPGRTHLGNVRPWQHLRDPEWKAPVFLNRLRERDYRRYFEQTAGLEIVDWRLEFTEGQECLTDEIRQQLRDFTIEELTRRSIIVVIPARDEGSRPEPLVQLRLSHHARGFIDEEGEEVERFGRQMNDGVAAQDLPTV